MDIRIDRLRLQVTGMHPDAARELTEVVQQLISGPAAPTERLTEQPAARSSEAVARA